ncbi:ribose transport system substrate-binding protein [Nakamurella sp. UYEF19]|uniref:substrate-binding domain-containing protein n=1 Tax=Nakamurella sp. UYEF19 TaxID=1756392 RepID=UPI003393D6F7
MIVNKTAMRLTAAVAIAASALAGCSKGSDTVAGSTTAASATAGGCADVVASSATAVAAATDPKPAWAGPTTGPKAATGKQIVYVAQTLTNPGVAGAAKDVQDAAAAIGWTARVIDGQGDAAGISAAFGQALALKPAGIVVGGFDPNSISAQITQANAANIPVIGWHALSDPGPSTTPKLFSNITTPVSAVAKISAQWIIAKSNGVAGVVVFTDNSIPFAAGKATMIEDALKACSTVKVLQVENIPIPDAGTRTPQEFSSLVSKLGAEWNYSVAINDLYFDNAGTPLRAAGKDGSGAPFNVGAGDGSAAAFQRIASKQFQAATVPEPLAQEGWQIVDEFNRAFNNAPASGYVPAVHVTDASNVGTSTSWDPANGYQDAYKKIWGK